MTDFNAKFVQYLPHRQQIDAIITLPKSAKPAYDEMARLGYRFEAESDENQAVIKIADSVTRECYDSITVRNDENIRNGFVDLLGRHKWQIGWVKR